MEYQRKFRWANYETPKCKEYLRNDFSHECAYCKLQEKEVWLIDSNYFEIDHFRPQAGDKKNFNPHLYNNLYYSCEKCNAEKSDIWSEILLDPCKDNIFADDDPPVKGGYDPKLLFKYFSKNEQGKYFIDTFKLNSRYHIRIRKQRINRQNNIRQIDLLMDEILHKFDSKKELKNLKELINQLDQLRISKKEELSHLSKDEHFEMVEKYLSKRDIKYSTVFEEYNMDIKIKIGSDSYYCELIVDDSEIDSEIKVKYVDTERLKIWFEKLEYQFGVLYYFPKLDKLYFYPISTLFKQEDLINLKSKKQIKVKDDNLIN